MEGKGDFWILLNGAKSYTIIMRKVLHLIEYNKNINQGYEQMFMKINNEIPNKKALKLSKRKRVQYKYYALHC